MKREAFMLLNCRMELQQCALDDLKMLEVKIESIDEIMASLFDFIIKIEAPTMEDLKNNMKEIMNLYGIRSTLSMIIPSNKKKLQA